MYNNFKAKFSGQELKNLFWKAASTYNVKQDMREMREIERVHPKSVRHCSCGMFQLVGYPCCHAIAACDDHRLELDDYVDDCLKEDTYLRVYRHMINHVPGIHDFEVSSLGKIEPPQVKPSEANVDEQHVNEQPNVSEALF
ncbi:hypothetical protein BUALT_Bualt08G0025700 [Buddleja alternifolia]|uniref:SWIM-type domain-containing protein n=1 Tax=Buddleja alternifolia TaxID=168488 RepID=A0AAV6X9P6_9LAMI|nr:hypothetical protein BUALT_Bualt08G0025700 [Buddleja alternifolia]